jgi:hypothetical protein
VCASGGGGGGGSGSGCILERVRACLPTEGKNETIEIATLTASISPTLHPTDTPLLLAFDCSCSAEMCRAKRVVEWWSVEWSAEWSVVSGVVSGQRSGQWSGQWSVVSGKWSVVTGGPVDRPTMHVLQLPPRSPRVFTISKRSLLRWIASTRVLGDSDVRSGRSIDRSMGVLSRRSFVFFWS